MVEAKDIVDQTLCRGTLNPEHLCDIFLPMCRTLGAPVPIEDFDSETGCEAEYWAQLWEEIFEALNEIAPEGTYFGGHVGDSSDIGFWTLESEDGNE